MNEVNGKFQDFVNDLPGVDILYLSYTNIVLIQAK